MVTWSDLTFPPINLNTMPLYTNEPKVLLITWFYKTEAVKTELTDLFLKSDVHLAIDNGLFHPPGNWDKYELTESIQ